MTKRYRGNSQILKILAYEDPERTNRYQIIWDIPDVYHPVYHGEIAIRCKHDGVTKRIDLLLAGLVKKYKLKDTGEVNLRIRRTG